MRTGIIILSMISLTYVKFSLAQNRLECHTDLCNRRGRCLANTTTSFTCQCDPGFTGPTCEQEINECLSQPCANNGTCTDLENGFLCHCTSEWNGTYCTEARNPCQSSPCGPFGKCVTTKQPQIPYYCECPNGQNTIFKCAEPIFDADRLDPCLPNPCGAGECETTGSILNGYICRCYDGTIQLTNCSLPTNPCLAMPCGVHGRCLVLSAAPRGYMCMCQNEGLAYTTIDTCPPPNTFCTPMSCQNGGTCIPYSEQERACSIAQTGSTCCLCPPNFTGLRCERMLDPCASNPCESNGRCFSSAMGYQCKCAQGFTGNNCQKRLASSACLSNPCTIGICHQLNQDGSSYVCICPDGTLNLSCNATRPTDIQYRSGNPKSVRPMQSMCDPKKRDVCNGGRCVMMFEGVYACRCRDGYTGVHCETNINECASNPCVGGGTCYDLVNAYVCFCPDRVFRSQCNGTKIPTATRATVSQVDRKVNNEPQLARTFCTSSTCENGGTCHQQGFNSMCRCKPGFTGLRCETEYFRCRSNGRFTDALNCKQGRYFECVYFGQYDLSLPNGILFSRNCPTGLWYSASNDRCDYPEAVQC